MNATFVPYHIRSNSIPSVCKPIDGESVPFSKSLGQKVGSFFRRAKRILTRTESKIVFLTSYWATETFIFAAFLMMNPPLLLALISSFIYIYASYVLYTALNILINR